jgi:acyl-CoA synthetase (AMP-forming)/AMP-acid ligase II
MSFSLFESIENSVRDHPERAAIMTRQGGRISYRRLAEMVDSFALRAARAGVSKGDHVIIRGEPHTWHLCMILALSKLGAVRVPALEPAFLAARGLRVDHIITDPTQPVAGPNVINMDRDWLEPPTATPTMPMGGFDSRRDLAIVMSSSGTTGRPKLLGFDLDLIKQGVDDQCSRMGTLPGRTFLIVPPNGVYGLEMALLTLSSGGEIIWPRKSLRAELTMLKDGHVDEIIGPPGAYAAFLKHLKADGTRLRSVCAGR